MGTEFKGQLNQDQQVLQFKKSLRYLFENDYLSNAETLLKNFTKFVQRSQQVIENAKVYSQVSDECKKLHECLFQVNQAKNDSDFKELALKLIETRKVLNNMKEQEQQTIKQNPKALDIEQYAKV